MRFLAGTEVCALAGMLIFLGSVPLNAATLAVGPGKTYARPSQAAAVAQNGDIIEIDAGLYSSNAATWTKHNLVIRGAGGGRPHLRDDGAANVANAKGIWVIQGTNTTVQNIEFSGAAVAASNGLNGAGIRQEGSGLVVSNCYFHDNQNGILTGVSAGHVLVEYSEFSRNGAGDGQSHNLYIGNIAKFTMRYCYSHEAVQGHTLKSRAKENYILYNRIMSETGGVTSYEVDFPNGGLIYMIGNLIQQGNLSPNSTIITFAEEGGSNPTQMLYVVNNTIVNDRAAGANFIKVSNSAPVVVALIMNNLFVGNGTLTNGIINYTNNMVLNGTQLVNRTGFDFHLIPGSVAIDQGKDPGVGFGYSLVPVRHYVHPAGMDERQTVLGLDLGAYECTDTDGDALPDNWERQYFGTISSFAAQPGNDSDGDGMQNFQEYQADTNPMNSNSVLRISGIEIGSGGLSVGIQGGSNAWQYLEYSTNLMGGATWLSLLTNAPPTAMATNVLFPSGSMPFRFYRISARRN